jgi:diguanylate cyclase (GGDEF)-like protein
LPGRSHASDSVVIDDWSCLLLGHHLEIYLDPGHSVTIDQASSSEFDQRFRPSDAVVPNLGMIRAAAWIRFRINNHQNELKKLLLSFEYPVTDRIELYIPQATGGFTKIIAGDSVRPSPEVPLNRFFVFPITAPPSETVYYMRVETTASMTLPLRLWKPADFERADHFAQTLHNLLCGAVIVFVIYFLVVAVKLRYLAPFWFSVYIVFLGSHTALRNGLLFASLGPVGEPFYNLLNLVVIGLLFFTGAAFLRNFLKVKDHSVRVDRILAVLQWMGLVYPVVIIVTPDVVRYIYSLVLFLIGPIFSTTVSIVFWAKGVRNARFFAIGWFIGHLAAVIDFLRITGLIGYQPYMDAMIPLSLVSSLIFFSMAIVDQIYTFKLFAHQDALTGLSNRRRLDEVLPQEWNRSLRHKRPLSVLMVDVDFFKAYNDTYGHRAGDRCLADVSGTLDRYARRAGDLAARYGGEEFVILLPEVPPDRAEEIAESVRQDVYDLGIEHESSEVEKVVTVSVGVAAMVPNKDFNPTDLIKLADEALYKAKADGRNRISTAAKPE